ncbi:type II toxin-antitoxin system toxin DNA ADP-ribosyl transferase DarT [Mucilaginibacter sp. P25]|uniref:DarT domain-containing protein n=1 Tax=Mucilaginibacter gossypii TaxID=551996 RepID=A0A1G8I2G6_9SPHI|nr:DUF4433 domain-containing protein [Mucilaginibacter gossypii]SDI13073.1 protein of unknown function [Mucilaginibacter gossypii]
MTHVENIPHILKNGITHQWSANSNKDYVPIGSGSLISKRESFILPNGEALGRYIPFYFGARMPMLYVIKQGANSIYYNMRPVSTEDIVYCITSVEQIRVHNLRFVFSNGHAVSDLTDFFYEADIDDILNIIDLSAINAQYWVDYNDLDLKRRKEAEFLVIDDIPASAILGFAVYNKNAKQKLLAFDISESKIVIKPDYYF